MNEFYTPQLLITGYYDYLVNKIDIFTEERIKKIKEKGLTKIQPEYSIEIEEKFDQEYNNLIKEMKNPYESQIYTIDRTDISETEIKEISQAEDYLNEVRQKAIDEIRKVQEVNLEYYKENKEKFKVDRKNLTEENLKELKSQLFATKFCFLIFVKPKTYFIDEKNPNRYEQIFNLHSIITDFYLRESDIEYIRYSFDSDYKIEHPSTKLDQRFLLANQVKKYLKDILDEGLNGYEIIQIFQKTLFEIQHIRVKSSLLYFNEANLSFDIDLSSIKSLSFELPQAKIADLRAFFNLEYLSISSTKLCQWPFQCLQKLIEIKLFKCDLSDFEFDSINSLTSLRIIYIYMENSPISINIDLSNLINLKFLELVFYKKELVKEEEEDNLPVNLIENSFNQLYYINFCGKTFDFSKIFDLPELKYLFISEVDLSQISKQVFYGMTSLIELNLKSTKLKNVDFLDTDRLGNLEILYLSYNQIEVLRKGAFSQLKKLKSLYLDYNLIEKLIPGVFEGLECLELLNIRENSMNDNPIDNTIFNGLNRLKDIIY